MNLKSSAASTPADAPLQRDTANRKYRPDIDGLRAIAVLSVLFFHVGFSRFSGGWVGVDVFFVISGYLITRLIMDEIEAGSFSFAGFYARRARRLFPSFIFTVATSFIAGSLIFDRIYLQHFAGEVVYALVAASNFFLLAGRRLLWRCRAVQAVATHLVAGRRRTILPDLAIDDRARSAPLQALSCCC